MEAVRWLREETLRIRRPLWRAGGFTALAAFATVGQAWFLARLLAAIVFPRAAAGPLWKSALFFLVAIGVRAYAVSLGRRTAEAASLGLRTDLRKRFLRHIQSLDPLTLRAQASGDLMVRLVDGIDALGPYYARYLPQASAAVIMPVIAVLAIFRADWVSGLILVCTAPFIPVFMVLVGHNAERAADQRFAQLRRLGAAFIEALGHLTTLRELGAAQRVADGLDAESETYRQLTMQVLRIAFLSSLVLEFFTTVSIALIAVFIGFRLLAHDLAFSAGLFVLLLAPELYAPLRALGTLRHARLEALAAAESLQHIEGAGRPPPAGKGAAPAAAPVLALQDVYFGYGGQPVLKGCSCTIRPGQVTALIGESGAGKSTILQLLLGFGQPASGVVTVDGKDLATLDPVGWRARVSLIPQAPTVFTGSLRHNLLLAMPSADPPTLDRALKESGLDTVVARLPAGLETPLGEHGVGLSGGQLQRLGLARAWLRTGACVWLFDEATAHLDRESAQCIGERIRAGASTRTVLLVAHRLEAAQKADWVIVLADGRVVEEGPPAMLASQAGAYSALLAAAAP